MTSSSGPSIIAGSERAVAATGLALSTWSPRTSPGGPKIFPDDVLHLVLLGLSAVVETGRYRRRTLPQAAGQRRPRQLLA